MSNQITAVLWNNGSWKSVLAEWMYEKRKSFLAFRPTDITKLWETNSKLLDFYDSKWNFIQDLSINLINSKQPQIKPLAGKDAFDKKNSVLIQATHTSDKDYKDLRHEDLSKVSSWQYIMWVMNKYMTEPEKTPDVLILDEVDNHLDDANRTLLLEYIVKITKLGKQLFVVTHNPFFLFNIMQMNNVAIWVISFQDDKTPPETTTFEEYVEEKAAGWSIDHKNVQTLMKVANMG